MRSVCVCGVVVGGILKKAKRHIFNCIGNQTRMTYRPGVSCIHNDRAYRVAYSTIPCTPGTQSRAHRSIPVCMCQKRGRYLHPVLLDAHDRAVRE